MQSSLTKTLGESTEGSGGVRRPSNDPEGDGELDSGAHVGRYVVLYRLGRGGMGVVYAAYDPQLDRKVAIKVMRHRGRPGGDDAGGRLLLEAQTLAKLSHPNVVAIHDVGLVADQVFVTMEYVEGQTLRAWLLAKQRSHAEILHAFIQAGEGLAAAHAAGIVHRDFKPENVIVGRDGRVQVLDFGLAQQRGQTESSALPGTGASSDSSGTAFGHTAGKPVGTPAYMAPEQHLGEEATAASDQFSFCVALYEALYGQLPFAGERIAELVVEVTQGRIRDLPRGSRVPQRLRKILLRGLSQAPEDRHASMPALLAVLRRQPDRRRRALVLAGMTGPMMIVAVWATGLVRTEHDPCAGGRARLVDVWDERVREDVARQLERSGRIHAPATVVAVEEALDDYARRWLAAHRDACEATHVRNEQSELLLDLRMTCLGRRVDELRALTRLLREADASVVDHAVEAAQSLPDVEPCADAAALGERVPMPSDPAVRERIAALEQRLAEVQASSAVGRDREALELVKSLVDAATELDYAPLRAEVNFALGTALEKVGDWENAVEPLRLAAIEGELAHDDRIVARARIELVGLEGDRLRRADQGKLWATLARASLQRIGGDPALEALLENNLGLVLMHEARPEEVLVHQQRAVELASRAETFAPLRRAQYDNNLAATLADLGRTEEALQKAHEALKIWTETLGPDHHATAMAIGTLGFIHESAGDSATALEHHERALAIVERSLGPGNPLVADLLSSVAVSAARLGDLERAEEAFRRVLALRIASFGDRHVEVAASYSNLGTLAFVAGQYERALAWHRKALELREELLGDDHIEIAAALDGIANALERLDRPHEALKYRKRGYAILEAKYGADHPAIAIETSNRAHNLMLVGQLDEALVLAERGLGLARRPGADAGALAYAELVVARVLTERRDDATRVRSLVDDALARIDDKPATAEHMLVDAIATRWGWKDLMR